MSAFNPSIRILETNRLTRNNYKDWLKNIKIVLSSEKIGYVLDQDSPTMPNHPTAEQHVTLEK